MKSATTKTKFAGTDNPIHTRLKALLIAIAAYDSAVLALLFALVWRR